MENAEAIDSENIVAESDESNNTVSVTTTALVAGSLTPGPTAHPTPGVVQGDADGNGDINAIDAFWALLVDAGLVDDVPVPGAGDVNEDGRADGCHRCAGHPLLHRRDNS